MRQTRDSFLHFLSDNLVGVPVHNVRVDVASPGAEKYQMNAVNVKFLDVSPSVQVGETLVEIAVTADNELDALTWVTKVFDLLSSAYQTPKMDYTNPASPVPVGTNIMWDLALKFRAIYQKEFYFDYRCVFRIHHRVNS